MLIVTHEGVSARWEQDPRKTLASRSSGHGSETEDGDRKPMALSQLSALAFLVGIVTGFGAIVFRALIGQIQNVLFLGNVSLQYDANLFTPPSPWGAFVIFIPVVGAIAVTFIVSKFAPEARGHGVPEVMDAISYQGGIIRPGGRKVHCFGDRNR